MEEKKNEQIINEKQDCQELDDNALEDTSGGIGERHFPDFRGLRDEISLSHSDGIKDFNKGLDVNVGDPTF